MMNPDILIGAQSAIAELVPSTSRSSYEKAYKHFQKWAAEKDSSGVFVEEVFLAYFAEMSKQWAPTTMWARYSMIKTMLNVEKTLNIASYVRLTAFLKSKSKGYKPKKSEVMDRESVIKFIKEAPTDKYLMIKVRIFYCFDVVMISLFQVALMFGIFGACRPCELTKMCVDDIEIAGNKLIITIPKTKTKVPRIFSVIGDEYIQLYRKYFDLRPKSIPTNRFFLKYANGKCTQQVVGINTVSTFPNVVATFLNLAKPRTYTGQCFRRSSATILADADTNITKIKQHCGWRSTAVAEGYIENSVANKINIAKRLLPSNPQNPSVTPANVPSLNIASDEVNFSKMPADSSNIVMSVLKHVINMETAGISSNSEAAHKENPITFGSNAGITISNCTFNINIK